MTGHRIPLPKGFKLGKSGKVEKKTYAPGSRLGIMQRKAAKPKVVSRAKAMGKEGA